MWWRLGDLPKCLASTPEAILYLRCAQNTACDCSHQRADSIADGPAVSLILSLGARVVCRV